MPKITEGYWTSDENGRSVYATREVGDEDTGEDNGHVAAAERMGTRQVIAGEDPNTGLLDQRGLDDVPALERRRSYETVEDARPEDMSADGRGGQPAPTGGKSDMVEETKDAVGAPENKARRGRPSSR